MIGALTAETTWQRAISHPVSLLGFAVMISGTVVGNIAVAKMANFMNDESVSVEREMFSPAKETESQGGKAKQAAAIKKYRETHPGGKLYGTLRLGWVLCGIGFLLMVGGAFI